MLGYIILFGVLGLLFGVFATPWVIKLAWHFGVVRYPPSHYLKQAQEKGIAIDRFKLMTIKRRLEKPPTPEWGGIAYVAGFLILSTIGLLISKDINLGAQLLSDYIWWGLSILFLFTINVIDDKFELSSIVLLIAYFVTSLLFIASNFLLDTVTLPFGNSLHIDIAQIGFWVGPLKVHFNIWTDLLLIPYFLFIILALKVQAGADAVMETNTFVALLWLAVLSFKTGLLTPAFLASILAGLLLGFIFYNWNPAKIWSGEAGDGTIGFIIATFSIIGRANLSAILILFALPIIDWAYVLLKRLRRILRTHKKVWLILKMSDKNHLHHRLMKLGLTEPKVALAEASATFLLGLILFITPIQYRNELLLITYVLIFIGMWITDILASKAELKKHITKEPQRIFTKIED